MPDVSYAPEGEDRTILSLFPPDFRGFAVDVGANDGLYYSNTLLLEQQGWTVLCIEPNIYYEVALHANRAGPILIVACGARNEESRELHLFRTENNVFAAHTSLAPSNPSTKRLSVEVRTLDHCLSEVGFSRLDVLSIDVEGTEMDVLDGFDLARWHPKVIVVENHRPHDARFVERFTPFGYRLHTTTTDNEVFVRDLQEP